MHTGTMPTPAGLVVLLTGSTGCLGSSILAELFACPDVRRVYALNRPSAFGRTLQDRQRRALIARGLDGALASSNKVVLLEGDISSPMMGLSGQYYAEVNEDVNCIFRSACSYTYLQLQKSATIVIHGGMVVLISRRDPETC